MRRAKKRELKKTILIIVDGESEQIYLKNSIKNENVYIRPELPKKKSLVKLYEYFKTEKTKYDKAFWIIDLDVPIKESKVNDIKTFKSNFPNEIIINNPCLEFWFLLHYELKNFDNRCDSVIKYLKKNYQNFKNYDKSKNSITNISDILKDRLNTAISNAKNRSCNLDNLINCSEMFKLFETIESY